MFLPEQLDNLTKAILRKAGYTLYRSSSPHSHLERRAKILNNYGIRLILDVGANTGQFAKSMRHIGYQHDIISFEPMLAPFTELERHCANDLRWACRNFGLGDVTETVAINISENSVSSSILPMMHEHLDNAPKSKFISSQSILVKKMDELGEWDEWTKKGPIWLKIDVQGFEDRVLNGAMGHLKHVKAIQLELSLVPLYEGQLTILPMMQLLNKCGFEPVAFEPGFTDKRTGESLQVDGIFRNRLLQP